VLRIALAVALALGALACQPSPTTPPLTPPASAATAETADPGGGWTPIELPDAGETWFAGGTVADSSGFLVFGGIGEVPAVWASSDGLDWHSAALPFGFGFPSEAAASLDATVLLGAGSTSRCAHPFGQSLWRRAAGADVWESVPFVEQLFCAGGFEEIAAAQHGFAVVGTGTGDQPFAWQSADGLAWHDASQGLPVNSPPNLLAAFDGGFIELGRGERTDVRTSVDGARWAPAEAPPVPPAFNGDAIGMSPAALIATNAGVLAVYQAEGAVDRSAWLRGADGSWRQVPMTGVEPGDIVAGGFGIGDDAYLFLGRGNAAALMTSRDLLSWNEVAIPRADSILDLAVIGDRIVLVTHKLELGGDVTRVFVNVRPPGGG
jgi:hypothetical protein